MADKKADGKKIAKKSIAKKAPAKKAPAKKTPVKITASLDAVFKEEDARVLALREDNPWRQYLLSLPRAEYVSACKLAPMLRSQHLATLDESDSLSPTCLLDQGQWSLLAKLVHHGAFKSCEDGVWLELVEDEVCDGRVPGEGLIEGLCQIIREGIQLRRVDIDMGIQIDGDLCVALVDAIGVGGTAKLQMVSFEDLGDASVLKIMQTFSTAPRLKSLTMDPNKRNYYSRSTFQAFKDNIAAGGFKSLEFPPLHEPRDEGAEWSDSAPDESENED